jgi:hypothetical protein
MSRAHHVSIALSAALLLIAGVEASTVSQTFVVTGILLSNDKSVIEGASVTIAEAKDRGFAISISSAGTTENPRVTTDAKGRFSITVRRSLFKDRQEFVLVVPVFVGTRPSADSPVRDGTVKIDRTRSKYKLGQITRDSPIVR